MSILQVEISEETKRQFEAWGAARNLDLQSWMREQIEAVLHEEEMASPLLAQKMDEALASGEPIIPNDEWWANLEKEALARRDANR